MKKRKDNNQQFIWSKSCACYWLCNEMIQNTDDVYWPLLESFWSIYSIKLASSAIAHKHTVQVYRPYSLWQQYFGTEFYWSFRAFQSLRLWIVMSFALFLLLLIHSVLYTFCVYVCMSWVLFALLFTSTKFICFQKAVENFFNKLLLVVWNAAGGVFTIWRKAEI